MPPPLALALTVLFIGYCLRHESGREPKVSSAVWIPTLWLMIIGSRAVSLWLAGGGFNFTTQQVEDGSPVDRAVYGTLILAGLVVLARRRVRVAEILQNNLVIAAFLLYEGISVVWSDFPLVAFRRWAKALGDPVMVMVLWSDAVPSRAIAGAIRRCAYVLIPLSVLFIKYYENWGRAFDQWGTATYTGVTTNKNLLGYLLFAFGLFFLAAILSRSANERRDSHGLPATAIHVVFLVMIGWLLLVADSKTALLALLAGSAVIVALRFEAVRKHFGLYTIIALLLATVLELSFSFSGNLVEAAGRDATFTGRSGLWDTLLQEPVNPIVGVGYASFWLGERLKRFWAMYPASPPTEAHNGYLEVYLNLGLVGLCLLTGVLWTGVRKLRARLTSALAESVNNDDRIVAAFGVAYAMAYPLYNVTEATFQGLNFLFVIFLMLAFEYRSTRPPVAKPRRRSVMARARQRIETRPAKRVRGVR